MGRGVKGKGRKKGGRGGKREGPPCSQPPLLKNPGYGPDSLRYINILIYLLTYLQRNITEDNAEARRA